MKVARGEACGPEIANEKGPEERILGMKWERGLRPGVVESVFEGVK